jgi:hypothetical protein
VHIGSPGATGFDWLFENIGGAANDFDFSHFIHTEIIIPPNLQCAAESFSVLNFVNCGGQFFPPFMELRFDISHNPPQNYILHPSEQILLQGIWTATPRVVPEPMSSSLVLFGLGTLGMWRRLRAKQD